MNKLAAIYLLALTLACDDEICTWDKPIDKEDNQICSSIANDSGRWLRHNCLQDLGYRQECVKQ